MRTLLLCMLLVASALAPLAAAQAPTNSTDPTAPTDGDYNSSAPADDTSYMDANATPGTVNGSNADSPSVTDADYNATTPTDDTSYMTDSATPAAIDAAAASPDTTGGTTSGTTATSTPATPTSATTAKTPGFDGALLVSAAIVAAVLAARKR